MSLPVPNLDDRRFQDIVDEAKQLIPRYCPEWTDHNVSDPGVALIELFAWMTELTLYRLNRVPDRLYVKFLELMGIQLFPPSAAHTELVFRFTTPPTQPFIIPTGTLVGTVRSERPEPIEFATLETVNARPAELVGCQLVAPDGTVTDAWDNLRTPHQEVACFPTLTAGESVCFGFDASLARHLVAMELVGVVAWVGVNPDAPPWQWEAWDGESWAPLPLVDDATLAFQRDGAVELLLPPGHRPLTLGSVRAHWVRCRLVSWDDVDRGDEPRSPRINRVRTHTVGVSAPAHHGRRMPRERLGRSDGTPGQRFVVRHRPVLPRESGETVQTIADGGVVEWQEVPDFSRSGPRDLHFQWDGATGEITFGPRIHQADGDPVQRGAIPRTDAQVVVTGYQVGGGAAGNVGAHRLTVLKSSHPFVASVDNPWPATGGVDAETVDNAKQRGPMTLLTSQRAVTAEDFEHLARQASPEVARARCLPPGAPRSEALASEEPEKDEDPWEGVPDYAREDLGMDHAHGGPPPPQAPAEKTPAEMAPVRVLIVPRRVLPPEAMDLEQLIPGDALLRDVQRYLDERRLVTTSVELTNVWFQGVRVQATVAPAPATTGDLASERALEALYRFINPLVGGPAGDGWPFDRSLSVGDIYVLLSAVKGVATVENVTLEPVVHMKRGEVGERAQTIPLAPDALFASYRHEVTTA